MKIPINLLKTCPINSEIYRDSDVGDLVNSIGEVGLLQPIVVTPENIIISGHRRFKAIQSLAGYTDINTARFNNIVYGNNKYVAAGGPQHNIFTSSDGTSWDNKSLSGGGRLDDLIFENGVFVAVGTGGHIHTSSDGISWTKTSASSNDFKGVTYGNSIFVAVAKNGVIYTSTDGTNWTETLSLNNSVATSPYKSPPSTSTLYGVTYGNSRFVAVGDYGAILTSTNGTSWTSRFSGSSTIPANLGSIQSVTYGNGIFVAVGNGTFPKTYVITSTDGITWTERTSGVSNYLWDVTYGE